jgi:hypothetical protein
MCRARALLADDQEQTAVVPGEAVYDRASAPLILRDTGQVAKLLDGFCLVEPGLVLVTAWHPDGTARGYDAFIGAVGRKD